MNLMNHIDRQSQFSQATFGPGQNTGRLLSELGNCRSCWKKSDRKLITVARKELAEIEAKPDGIYERVDLIILAMDGATRTAVDRRDRD
jgi:hypothetical protein